MDISQLKANDKVIVTKKGKDLEAIVVQVTLYFVAVQLEHYRECFYPEYLIVKVGD